MSSDAPLIYRDASQGPRPSRGPDDPGAGGFRRVDVTRLLAQGVFSIAGFVGLWAVAARLVDTPYLLPGPAAVARSASRNRSILADHGLTTLAEILAGFALGFALAAILGYALYRSPRAEAVLMPYIVASQAVPVVAVAPLLIFWFGAGFTVKALTAAVIVFFPMLVNTVAGLRGIDPEYRALMRAMSASPWQTLFKLEIPAALPVLLAGLRVGATLSVIGAVVGEFLGSDRGLGALVRIAGGQFDDPLRFAALLSLVALALSLYAVAAATESFLLRFRQTTLTRGTLP